MTYIQHIIAIVLAGGSLGFLILLIIAFYETQRPTKPHRRYGKGLSSKADPL